MDNQRRRKSPFTELNPMPNRLIALSDKEMELIQEVQTKLNHESIEQTLEYLARERISQMLAKLAGQEIKKKYRHLD